MAVGLLLAVLFVTGCDCAREPSEPVVMAAPEAPEAARLPAALIAALEKQDPMALADTRLPRLSQINLDALIPVIDKWPIPRRVAGYAFLMVGSPYVLGSLGEETAPDTDPLIRYDVADCATLNLIAEALAHATEYKSPRDAMKFANYRDGIVSYENRLHFTTDRLDVSPFDRDITRDVAGGGGEEGVAVLNLRSDGKKWIPIDWQRKRAIYYIPAKTAAEFPAWFRDKKIPELMGVAFVQKKFFSDGLDVVHESLLWKGETLLHGSSLIGRVVTVNWTDFLKERGHRYDGFVVFEYR